MKSLWLLLVAISVADCAKILGVFNYPSYSHQIVFQKIVKDLSARGHHLTILTVNRINDNFPNVTEIYLDGSYDYSYSFAEAREKKYSVFRIFAGIGYNAIRRSIHQFNNPELKELIADAKNQKFDLILQEYLFPEAFIYLAEIFDCPVVAVASMEVSNAMHSIMGNYVNYAVHSDFFYFSEENSSLMQRFKAVTSQAILGLFTSIIKLTGPLVFCKLISNGTCSSVGDVEERRIEFLLQNANPVLCNTRPVTHNTIMLGSLHIEPPKELGADIKDILDSSKNGVIYVSFGSNVNTNSINSQTMSIFLNTFKKLNYDILWKLDGNVINSSPNIHISKWYPQADLLAHPKVKLFITHCGLMSFEESVDREVPMLAIPFLFDQFKNSWVVEKEKIGIRLKYELLTEESLYNGIMEALKPKYTENIRKFKKLMYDFPMTSRERAVWWIEYALRNKKHNPLKYTAKRIPFYQKYSLDVIGIIFIFLYSIKKVFGYLRKKVAIKNKIE